MKKLTILCSMFFAFALMSFGYSQTSDRKSMVSATTLPKMIVTESHSEMYRDTKIQVAILLDTSSSMDGLIEQAKSRLWNIVNTLTTLKYNGRSPRIEIALYEYGNDNLRRQDDYIRQVAPLTTDLDLISERLFSLTTYGGDEYCGAVIGKAVKSLDWGNNSSDMKLIYIAGNEPFTQGKTSYKAAIEDALSKGIFVNTIHCGNESSGVNGMWRDGAIRGKGKFFNINHNQKVRYYDTPYDDRISECNARLNDTYISYGRTGHLKKQSQAVQDQNASTISKSNFAERAVSKSKDAYTNSTWDLVDKMKENESAIEEISQADLPAELQNKSKAEIKKVVKQKESERTAIQKEISELAKKRQTYIEEQMKKDDSNTGDDLGKAINESILAIANIKGYKQEK